MTKRRFTATHHPAQPYLKDAHPFLKFGGKWLRECGINVGDQLELIQGKNMLILMKVKNDT
jgi:hypothetical protein